MKRNAFIVAAMEELQQEVAESADTGVAVATPAAGDTPAGDGAPAVVETNIDQSVDAVAALMSKNTEIAAENEELVGEVFDNDADVIDTSSDTVEQDLEEAVNAAVALEQLAHLADLTVKSGQANKASVASLAFALEQITDRVGMTALTASLEDEEGKEPAEQAKGVGEKAKELAVKIGKALVEGIKRIWQWVMNFFRNLFTRVGKVAEKAKALRAQVKDIDDSATISDAGFIKSLRIPEGKESITDYYHHFGEFAHNAINFFDKDFVDLMEKMYNELCTDKRVTAPWEDVILPNVSLAQKTLFPYEPTAGTADGLGEDITAWATPRMPGGVQLFMAWRPDPDSLSKIYLKVGRAKDPELRAPESIPALSAKDADFFLGQVEKWMGEFKQLEKSLARIKRIGFGHSETKHTWAGKEITTYNHVFITMLSGLTTSTLPHLLNLCVLNSHRLIAYTEKSIAASKAGKGEAK